MLAHNLDATPNPTARSKPAPGESPRPDEPGHVALALGEYHRATPGETTLKVLLTFVDLAAARCITAQMFTEPPAENGPRLRRARAPPLPARPRNATPCGERLVDETAATPIDKALFHRSDYDNRTGRRSTSPRPSHASASAFPRKTKPRG